MKAAGSINAAPDGTKPCSHYTTDGLCYAEIFCGSFLYSVGDAENLNKGTIYRPITHVCLLLKSLIHIFITLPGHKEPLHIKRGFTRLQEHQFHLATIRFLFNRLQLDTHYFLLQLFLISLL